jgi:hypothetical protein
MDTTLNGLRGAALELFTSAREAGQYEMAYHALCALLHAGEAMDDEATCRLVEQRAHECRDWIDLHAPEHRLSTRSAQARGHEGIFRQLTVTAESARLRIGLQKRQGRPKAPLSAART